MLLKELQAANLITPGHVQMGAIVYPIYSRENSGTAAVGFSHPRATIINWKLPLLYWAVESTVVSRFYRNPVNASGRLIVSQISGVVFIPFDRAMEDKHDNKTLIGFVCEENELIFVREYE